MTNVIKSEAELYQIRQNGSSGWGDIVLVCGKESVRVMINSDFGSYSHIWTHCGGDPKEFLTEVDFDYCMKKLTDYNHYVPAPEEYPTEVKRRIIEARQDDNLTKAEAREAWEDMLNTEYDEGDLYFKELIDHHLFEKVFYDYEYLPCAKKIAPRCQMFWDNVWLPFIEQLKTELTQYSN